MALINCPECGKEVSTRAGACPQCGCPVGQQQGMPTPSRKVYWNPSPTAASIPLSPQTSKPDETLGTFLIMIPLAAAGLVFFWVGSMRMIDGPWSKLSLLAVGTVLLTAGLVSMEAQRLGFGNDPRRPRSERDGPVVWFFGMVLVWFIAYPRYLYLRSRYGARNLLLAGLVSMAIWFVAFGYIGTNITTAQDQFQKTIQELQR